MSEALYRKYRPTSFADVMGQDHIIKVLEGALKLGNVAHAYLLHGSRGTGKTTIARIIASKLGTADEDIIEIDAASNRGIDDIRELREGVTTAPFRSQYKIYIIDEAHMLTKEAWNALLKTLEEPPAHVIFILATTELEKVPETIISRCQVFMFKKPTLSVLKELVISIAKKEGFNIEPAGAELVALLGDGSFRDTHGILQKIFSFSKDKTISREEIESVTGAPSGALVEQFIRSLAVRDLGEGLRALSSADEHTIDMELFLKLVLSKLRSALLLRFAPDMKDELLFSMTEHDKEFILGILKEKGGAISSQSLERLLEAGEMVKYASVKTLPLELALLKILEKEK